MSDVAHNDTPGGISTKPIYPPRMHGVGSKDGQGAGDHDMQFAGHRVYHFSTRQMLNLLLLRGEVLNARLGQGRFADDTLLAEPATDAGSGGKVDRFPLSGPTSKTA